MLHETYAGNLLIGSDLMLLALAMQEIIGCYLGCDLGCLLPRGGFSQWRK